MGRQAEGTREKRRICVGLMAHVDAGKTTLAEGLLYTAGAVRRLGRVDHADAFLDTDPMERRRGITIFSKQAVAEVEGAVLTLLDTPGHADFAAEAERVLQVLDCAVLVVSGTDPVQGHTRTLWRLLERYAVPTVLFVNKMDLAGADPGAVLEALGGLGEGFVDFTHLSPDALAEELALRDEGLLEAYLEGTPPGEGDVAALVGARKVFPCFFGSALKLEGVEDLLTRLPALLPAPAWPEAFSARVFKITRDPQGQRLTHLRVTGGILRVKDLIRGEGWEEKADQLRLYSGEKFRPLEEAPAGTVCAVAGLSHTRPGQGLGEAEEGRRALLEGAWCCRVELPEGLAPHTALEKLRQLEEEDPQLRVLWDQELEELRLQVMGAVQLEVLEDKIRERFGFSVTFGPPGILYKETVAAPVEGVGHFEPLRHYAEVHLLLEPGEPGSGVTVAAACPQEVLAGNWQRLILTHLTERTHRGVLTGAPLTDVRITLLSGRAHEKHTEGGDFRQATYRAVRHGLRRGESVLLEPWYTFTLEVPADTAGRAMADLQRLGAQGEGPVSRGMDMVFSGSAPAAVLGDYQREVTAYTRGQGRLSCAFGGYRPCHNTPEVVEAAGYDPDRDTAHPCGSVFCSHGAGHAVEWDQVEAHMHLPWAYVPREEGPDPDPAPAPRPRREAGGFDQDKELQAIFERTYGKVERRAFQPQKKPARTSLDDRKYHIRQEKTGPEYLLVDGYNIIWAWEDLRALAAQDVDAAREALTDILADYRSQRGCQVILVFDAYKVKGNPGSVERRKGLYVVYTREAETADAYIEKATYDLGKDHRVRVATSDYLEQLIILGHGALRLSARAFRQEVEESRGELTRLIQAHNRKNTGMDKLRHTARVVPRAPEKET